MSEVYIVSNNDNFIDGAAKTRNDKVKNDIKYSSGEKMMISISHDKENVYLDKLLITVNEDDKHDEVVNCEGSNAFDPDTLGHKLDKGNELGKFEFDVQDTFQDQDVIIGKHF